MRPWVLEKGGKEICPSSNFVNVKPSQQYLNVSNILSAWKSLIWKGKRKKLKQFKCRLFLGVTPFIFLSLCSHMLPDRLSKGEEVSRWLKFYLPGMLIFSQTCHRIAVGPVKTQSAHDLLPAFVGQRSAEPSFLTTIISLPQIFFFCFNFLKHIVSEKFSAVKKQRWVCLFIWRESIFHSF